MCDTGFIELEDTLSSAEAVRNYSANKRWYDTYSNKCKKLMGLIDKGYDRRTVDKIDIILTKMENTCAVLAQIAEFLKQKAYATFQEHLDKVVGLEEEVQKWWERFVNGWA